MRLQGIAAGVIALLLACPMSVSAANRVTFKQKVVDADHPIEFYVRMPVAGHLEGRANWSGSWLDGTGLLYIVKYATAECSIAGGKPLSCTVNDEWSGDGSYVAPAGWYEVELSVAGNSTQLNNVSVSVSGDFDLVYD